MCGVMKAAGETEVLSAWGCLSIGLEIHVVRCDGPKPTLVFDIQSFWFWWSENHRITEIGKVP